MRFNNWLLPHIHIDRFPAQLLRTYNPPIEACTIPYLLNFTNLNFFSPYYPASLIRATLWGFGTAEPGWERCINNSGQSYISAMVWTKHAEVVER